MLHKKEWPTEIQVLGREKSYFVKNPSDSNKKFSETNIIKMLDFLFDNIFVTFGGRVFQQTVGSSNILEAPAQGVYISQLIRYSRAYISYYDSLDRWLLLTRKLLNQEFKMVMLKSSLRKFYERHHELVDRYRITVSQMISDMFLMS